MLEAHGMNRTIVTLVLLQAVGCILISRHISAEKNCYFVGVELLTQGNFIKL
jgi:hypothetical protein